MVVNNSSRLGSDIKRDVGKIGKIFRLISMLFFNAILSHEREVPLVLLIIKPTNNTSEMPHFGQREDERIKHICFFLIDVNNATKLHSSEVNKGSVTFLDKCIANE